MDYTNPQYWPQLMALAVQIDTLDYFQILNLQQTATPSELRTAYYQLARAIHPDKFFTIGDDNLRAAIHKIYKRVTESYTILKDDPKRQKYVAAINGPNRASSLRYNEELVAQEKQEQRDRKDVAKTPQGKKMYKAALLEMKNGHYDKALRNIQSALMFEPANEQLKKLKDDIAAKKG